MAKPALDLDSLTASEKFELIDELWQSLEPDDLKLTPEQRIELDRRIDRLDREGPAGKPWQVVRDQMTDSTK